MTARGNLGSGERAASAVLGVALSVLSARRGGTILRTLAGIAGASLLARSLAGHCAMKAALQGDSSLRQGLSDQWSHTGAIAAKLREAAQNIRSGAGRRSVEDQGSVTLGGPGVADQRRSEQTA
jgi:hypothetical protein